MSCPRPGLLKGPRVVGVKESVFQTYSFHFVVESSLRGLVYWKLGDGFPCR